MNDMILYIFIAISIVIVFIYIRGMIIDKKIMICSEAIKKLDELNNKTTFYTIERKISIRKHYDNKRSYLRVEPGYLMTSVVKENIESFATIISNIKENRELLASYIEKVRDIASYQQDNYGINKVSIREIRRREKKILRKKVIQPVVDIFVIVNMSYSSPKGQVNLSKSDTFNFEDLLSSFESISRKYLSKETRQALNTVVRGNLSDSLRFDILSRDDFRCVICGVSSREGARLHVDHIVPVSKGGRSIPKNLQTLCERCNIGKSNKTTFNIDNEDNSFELESCPKCGSKLVIRKGKNGTFLGCSSFPNCRYTKSVQ